MLSEWFSQSTHLPVYTVTVGFLHNSNSNLHVKINYATAKHRLTTTIVGYSIIVSIVPSEVCDVESDTHSKI